MELYGRVKKLHEWNASYLQGPQFVDLSNSKTIGVLMTAKLISALKSNQLQGYQKRSEYSCISSILGTEYPYSE
jgi:hypothetical protein